MKGATTAALGAEPGSGNNLRLTLLISASFGLLAGFGEGIFDLTTLHFRTREIFCVTLPCDLVLFLGLGLLLWACATLFRRSLPPWVACFALGGLLLYYVPAGRPPSSVYQWLLFIGSFAVSSLAAVLLREWRQPSPAVAARAVRCLGAAAAICIVAIPAWRAWSERRALASLPQISPAAPNVVLLIIDTTRADHLSAYGYDRPTSPQIANLASQGVLFDTAISPASWTLPAHASLITGTYSHVHRTDTANAQLPSRFVTLPSMMERNGYRTAAFAANTFFFTRQHGFGRGFTHFGDFFQSPAEALAQVHYVAAADRYLVQHRWLDNFLGRQTAADINRAALGWIDSSHRPFFLALNYLDAHDPYVPPQPWRHMFSRRMHPGGLIDISENVIPKLAPPQIQDEEAAYDGGIAYADHELGLLVDALQQRGLLQNTLIVVTSDHGEAFGQHGFFDHGNALYFPLIHVPLVFYWPGHVPAGVRVARPVSTKDVGATILSLIHSRAGGFPGQSLAALWTGQANPDSWPMPISELAKLKFSSTFPNDYGSLASIVTPEMQYIVDPRQGVLLYNWKADPLETRNLYPQSPYRQLADQLATELTMSGAQMYIPAPASVPPSTAVASRR